MSFNGITNFGYQDSFKSNSYSDEQPCNQDGLNDNEMLLPPIDTNYTLVDRLNNYVKTHLEHGNSFATKDTLHSKHIRCKKSPNELYKRSDDY